MGDRKMAIVEMTKRVAARLGYEYAETIADGQNGDTIKVLPLGPENCVATCRVIAGAGSGKLQFSTSPDADVLDGTAIWSDWAKGAVTGTDWDVLRGQVTALRGVSVSGEIKIEILI
jgi:hypothetical protein